MIYLILAVTSSMLVSVIMRVSEKYIHNNITMLASNYLMCSVLAAICTGTWNLFPVSAEGFPFSVGLGLISGLFYMVQVIGMIVALAAILLINLEKGSGKAASSLGLVLLLVAGGATDAMSKVYEELGVRALKNHFLLYTFMMAFALCVVVCLVKKQGVTKEDVGFGLVIGIPNFCSALFLLLSLADIPAMIAYPTYSVAAIVMVTLVGVIFFKEKLSRRQILSMFMIFAALVLLNI